MNINAISINGMTMSPAPFISTSYEYYTSYDYIIGGKLIVNLNGTLAGENIISEMYSIGQLQTNQNCVQLIIGCDGSDDFLSGSGKITNVDISSSQNQPFIAQYTLTIAIESIDGKPVVKPDPQFLSQYCLTEEDAEFISSYSETLSIEGNSNSIGLVDDEFNISKSFTKASGTIKITLMNHSVCGTPSFNSTDKMINIIKKRAAALMNFEFCGSSDNPFKNYSGWNKWLDSKTLQIDDSGNATWSFDVYLSSGTCAPYAWIDINNEDIKQYRNSASPRKTRRINGIIRGLSSSTSSFLDNKSLSNEKLTNAKKALGIILPQVITGNWPGLDTTLTGEQGDCKFITINSICKQEEVEKVCYQRISSSISTSIVNGEIKFDAEYGDINACKPLGEASLDVTIEESPPVAKYTEFIIPSLGDSIIHYIGDTPYSATVTVRGTLKGCDTIKMKNIIKCVDEQFIKSSQKYNGWLIKDTKLIDSTYSYTRTSTFIKCDTRSRR